MSDIINTIKGSKAIVVLLILYTAIAILVVALDASGNKSSSLKNSNDAAKEKFAIEMQDVYDDIDDFVVSNDVNVDECIALSYILSAKTSGSVYVVDDGVYNIWYGDKDQGYYLNGVKLNGSKISIDKIDTNFNTQSYNTCGK